MLSKLWRGIFLVLATLILFPKGGIKIEGVPITFGYLLLFALALFLLFVKRIYRIKQAHFFVFIALLPLQIIAILTFGINGIANIGFSLSFFVSFLFLPSIFLLLLSREIEEFLSWEELLSFNQKALLFLASLGIFIFCYAAITGTLIEIPLITTNLDDLGHTIEKYNSRGSFVKLISTFENGNIYGLCALMLLPLYLIKETNFWKILIVKLSIVLTLSRTAWIGLFLTELFMHFFVKKGQKTLSLLLSLLLYTGVIIALLFICNIYSLFEGDSDFGGRIQQYLLIKDMKLFSASPFYGICEVIYMGVLQSFGLTGLIAFLLAICSPLILAFRKIPFSIEQRAIFSSLLIYLIIAWSDGAILLIPVMAFYWLLSTLLLANMSRQKVD